MLCKLSVSMKIFSHPNRIREKFTLKYAASMAVMLTVCLKKKKQVKFVWNWFQFKIQFKDGELSSRANCKMRTPWDA